MKARLMLRLRRMRRRLEERRRLWTADEQPVDEAWSQMLARAGTAEAERRLAAAESALNRLRMH